ncbi:Sensor protein KdpD [Delftia tsuruhatensis]|uniref:sensor histidine kinase n=1 Tax=Delftia tsuruhatensis TaxID=180282 RepID=UPI001E73B631|nr:ATP-binding protein [Delftia tsuruhatensis]CAB5695711.1 Sensor protein KdpD [Delftia tsuruhatensis]CAC9678244.1 Sensor protein KdpD [Delftia tsuruhatensis]
MPPPDKGLRLGKDLPMQVLVDAGRDMTVTQVAALPDDAFETRNAPLNEGYTRQAYWVRVAMPALAPSSPLARDDPLWLEITPTYLDKVTLYQQVHGLWQARESGDTVPMTQRIHVRQLVFPLRPGQPFLLRLETSSAMQLYATVWRSTGLLAWLSSVEWASGVHQGVNLVLTLLIGGAALALRMRSLIAMTLLAFVVLTHNANVRGYAQLWLPEPWSPHADIWVSVGVFLLPAAFAWQARETLTQGTAWRRIDRMLVLLTLAPLLAVLSIPAGYYTQWAWLGVSVPWMVSALSALVAWNNLFRQGATIVNLLVLIPYSLHAVMGLHVAAAYTGLVTSSVEAGLYWQLESLLLYILIIIAVGASLVEKFQSSMGRQAQLVESLARSEHALEARVRMRTAELLHAQNALQAALHGERTLRLEQRQFFNMVNHEFRTPLAVMDSAATEQLTFPSSDIDEQLERAAQIRRACRRLTGLVDNCLVSDRLDAPAFRLQLDRVNVMDLIDDAVQLVHWSRRHRLALETAGAPALWECDPTLVRIALSNLVDNAVKYAQAGDIAVRARTDAQGRLELTVSDQGPGLAPELAQRIFELHERGEHADKTRGFGLGLWVARRVAQMHGGDAQVCPAPGGGTCFTLTLPPEIPEDGGLPPTTPTGPPPGTATTPSPDTPCSPDSSNAA